MAYENIFDLLSNVFMTAGVPALLIGGYAVNYHRFTRTTGDIDFLMVEKDFDEKAGPLFEEAGCEQISRSKLFVTLKSRTQPFMYIDIGFVNRETLVRMIQDGKETEMMGRRFVVPSLDHLIALKLHALKNNPEVRERWDLRDILELIEVNRVNVETDAFRELCLKYGTETLYLKIKEHASKWKS